MGKFDKVIVEKILSQIEESNLWDSRFRFCRHEDGRMILLGYGGNSYVYDVYDVKNLNKHYAAKIVGINGMHADDNRTLLKRIQIQQEISAMSENVVKIHGLLSLKIWMYESANIIDICSQEKDDMKRENGTEIHIIFMEKLECIVNKEKDIRLYSDKLEDEKEVINLAKQIGSAVMILHDNGYLHRDIKLENIFWDDEKKIYKLGDFGVTKYIGNGNAETVVYTNGYGAPEIGIQMDRPYNTSVDIYALGITLYLLLNDLRFPFSEGYYPNKLQYLQNGPLQPPSNASEKMCKIIQKMCRNNPEERYSYISEVFLDIENIDISNSSSVHSYAGNDVLTEYTECTEYTEFIDTEEKDLSSDLDTFKFNDNETLSREERKTRYTDEMYYFRSNSIFIMTISSLVFACIFNSYQEYSKYCFSWHLWAIPVTFLANAFLREVKKYNVMLYIDMTLMSLLFIVLFMIDKSYNNMYVFLAIICVLIRSSDLLTGFAVGNILWNMNVVSGKVLFLDYIGIAKYRWILKIIICCIFIYVVKRNKKIQP